jgi:hypothetical protein
MTSCRDYYGLNMDSIPQRSIDKGLVLRVAILECVMGHQEVEPYEMFLGHWVLSLKGIIGLLSLSFSLLPG